MDVIMPQLGETVLEGSVAAWYKKAGDTVNADEPLFEVETEKVTTEVPAPASGVLAKILVEPGVSVKVGTRLAVIEAAASAGRGSSQHDATAVGATRNDPDAASAGRSAPSQASRPSRLKLSPLVRRLLREHDVDPQTVQGTGRGGRILPKDVLAHRDRARAESARAPEEDRRVREAPAEPREVERGPVPSVGPDDYAAPLSKIRRATAAHMTRSKAISPHTLQAVEVDFHNVERARAAFGPQWKQQEGYSLTYLPFVARAVCDALARFPYVNSSFGVDELIVHKRVHLGVAVDLNFEGLAVVVLRDASHLNLRGLAKQLHKLVEGVRSAKLQPAELTGATYTISNSGSFGTYFSAPIINQPQAAILSMDGVRKKPVVIERPDGDVIAIRPVGVLAQSFDHRAFDGAYSAAFLKFLKENIEERDWAAEFA
ncbi:MAG: dihydrolipoamide acetyltransferase family protein [Steroidobacteraceae bacterium]|jgi:2-oxoglutarate dehydrogenase E2 component (dihydrolipoamide succinyltransferase)|nr:dihydrolipoamide acetyltransferase family protein [Steroidobacteraceae bacterium]